MGKCFFWYWLSRVVLDKTVVCVCMLVLHTMLAPWLVVIIFRLHRICIAYMMGPIATDVSVVCQSVWNVTTRYPAKKAGPIEMPFRMWGGVGDSHHVLDLSLIHI